MVIRVLLVQTMYLSMLQFLLVMKSTDPIIVLFYQNRYFLSYYSLLFIIFKEIFMVTKFQYYYLTVKNRYQLNSYLFCFLMSIRKLVDVQKTV